MVRYRREEYLIGQLLRWQRKKQLVLQPKFQRRKAWDDKARSYLVDTIVRDLPMPKIFLRKIMDPETKISAYEVVDGQQRLTAIIDFHKGDLVLRKQHYPELGDVTFDGLPGPLQRRFLGYEISTEIMENATDTEVWKMFERVNSTALTLNPQERLNAEFYGYFKQSAYTLAAEEFALRTWKNLEVFGDRQIARMAEVELTSDVLVAIVEGISDITDIRKAYETYDDEFPKREESEDTFRKSLAFIATDLPEAIRNTRFGNRAWFYSLMVAVADALVGIPEGQGPGKLGPTREILERMPAIDNALRTEEPPAGLAKLQKAISRGTSHKPQRRDRHDYFFEMLTLSESTWRERWKQVTSSI